MVVKLSYHQDDIVSCIVDSILSSNHGLISDRFKVKWKQPDILFDLAKLNFHSKLEILFWSQIWQRIDTTIEAEKKKYWFRKPTMKLL